MAEYIDRKALIGKLEKRYCVPCKGQDGDLCGDWCRFCMASNAIKEVQKTPAADVEPVRRWIPVSEKMPKERGFYLVAVKNWCDGKPVTREAFWNGADWLSCEKRVEITPRVTHWMPLPKPPEMDGGTYNG